jgi:hypothetical protein
MPLFTIASNGNPAPWPVAVYHGQRVRYQITFTDLTNLTGWTIQAAISDHRGISRFVEADIDITGNIAVIEFSLSQIAALPDGQYLADCTAESPTGDPWVLLRSIWAIKGGAVY